MVVRKATANKSMRVTWADGATNVDVNFWAKGPAKSQVAVQHEKLAGVADVARRKKYWAAALSKLQAVLEKKNGMSATPAKKRPAARRKTG